ncbi:sulfurtransferase [Candidatus Magnetomorum sp. HK-1]|nr:sulfurtransferase [Candidatus Magnetomorum sp. HK-1]
MKSYFIVKNCLSVLTFCLFFACSLFASDAEYFEVTAPEIKLLMNQNKILLINSMSSFEYDRQHIPGSINIPLNEMYTTKKLPEKTDMLIAFYCMGPR